MLAPPLPPAWLSHTSALPRSESSQTFPPGNRKESLWSVFRRLLSTSWHWDPNRSILELVILPPLSSCLKALPRLVAPASTPSQPASTLSPWPLGVTSRLLLPVPPLCSHQPLTLTCIFLKAPLASWLAFPHQRPLSPFLMPEEVFSKANQTVTWGYFQDLEARLSPALSSG